MLHTVRTHIHVYMYVHVHVGKFTKYVCTYMSMYMHTLPEGEVGRLTMASSNRRMVADLKIRQELFNSKFRV